VTTWLKRLQTGRSPIGDSERLSDEDRAREMFVLGLRMNAGVETAEFRRQTAFDIDQLVGETISRYCRLGLLERTDRHIRLTREGRFVADTVVGDFL